VSESVSVLEVTVQVTDQTADGARSATENVSKLEKAMLNMQKEIDKINKMSALEITMYAIDKASKVIDGVFKTGMNIAGKVWNVTLKAVDLITAPVRGVINLLKNPVFQMAGIAGISLGTADTINTYATFEQSMANVRAIMGASDRDMEKIERGVRQISLDTGVKVTDLAENIKMVAEADGNIGLMMEQLRHGANLATLIFLPLP
jgi:wobble nucleotide-excising tRNase